MWLVEVVLKLIVLVPVVVFVYQNAYPQMDYAGSLNPRPSFGKQTSIIDESFLSYGGGSPKMVELTEVTEQNVVLPEKINGTRKTVQQDE